MKKVGEHLIFSVDFYSSIKRVNCYMFGHSMTGLYINECSNVLDAFKLELDKIVDAKKRLRFDRLRFGFREGDKMSYYDVSKEEYLRCKCDIVKPIFNMLYDGFYSCKD